MNKELKGRIFDIPQDILDKINHTVVGLNGENTRGIERAKKLLIDKKVKYGQLKRIIHDCEHISDISTRALIKKFGTQSMAALPITDKDNHLIALLCMDWVFSEHVEIYCENEEFTKNFKEEFKTDTESVKNFLI